MTAQYQQGCRYRRAFTLAEMLVSIAVLTVLVLFTTRLFNSATSVTTAGTKRVDANAAARAVLDRVQVDLASMLKRNDLNAYVKDPTNAMTGNDQIAFFSEVPGYYPASGSQSSTSLVAYRVNSTPGDIAFNKLERLAKGLVWNGVSATDTPLVFLPLTIAATWPAATNGSADADYELLGGQVFRFEYFYRLANGNLSDTPWTGATGHTSLAGFQDVTSVEIAIAVIDPKSRVIVSDAHLTDFANSDLVDFSSTTTNAGDLMAAWQTAADTTTKIPRAAASSIRFAHRTMLLVPR